MHILRINVQSHASLKSNKHHRSNKLNKSDHKRNPKKNHLPTPRPRKKPPLPSPFPAAWGEGSSSILPRGGSSSVPVLPTTNPARRIVTRSLRRGRVMEVGSSLRLEGEENSWLGRLRELIVLFTLQQLLYLRHVSNECFVSMVK